jgi:hypothetical protein
MGFSTLTEAILFKETATKHNVTSGIIAHENKATNNLFNMSKLYYDNLPLPVKPQIQNRNAQELIFNNADNTGLNSKIVCMTADKDAGRSGTYNFLHLSEFAFWQGNKEEAFTSIMQTVPNNENSMVIIERTANGYEYFKTLWDKAVRHETDFVPVFVGWNELTEYSMPYSGFEKTKEERRDKIYDAVIGRPVRRESLDLVREGVLKIDEEGAMRLDGVRRAEVELQKRISEAETARNVYIAASKNRMKIDEHKAVWREEEAREAEFRAESELEDFTGRKQDLDD